MATKILIMPTTMTKAAINKLLVEERAVMRSKHKQSAFMKKTLSIYNGQKKRAADLGASLVFSIGDFRAMATAALEHGYCYYCKQRLTLSKIAFDHRTAVAREGKFTLENSRVICQSCNWRKSTMDERQFRLLNKFFAKYFPPDVVSDIWRRLVIGAKWSPR